MPSTLAPVVQPFELAIEDVHLHGELQVPPHAHALVIVAQPGDVARSRARDGAIARELQLHQLGTLTLDLLSPHETVVDEITHWYRFEVHRLAYRLAAAAATLKTLPQTAALPIGCIGFGTGAAVALIAAARRPELLGCIVAGGGRPDLAGAALADVRAPTLLIVGGRDSAILTLNRQALVHLHCPAALKCIPGASHLLMEAAAVQRTTRLAVRWFERHLAASAPAH